MPCELMNELKGNFSGLQSSASKLQKNPYVWDESASRIGSEVVSLNFKQNLYGGAQNKIPVDSVQNITVRLKVNNEENTTPDSSNLINGAFSLYYKYNSSYLIKNTTVSPLDHLPSFKTHSKSDVIIIQFGFNSSVHDATIYLQHSKKPNRLEFFKKFQGEENNEENNNGAYSNGTYSIISEREAITDWNVGVSFSFRSDYHGENLKNSSLDSITNSSTKFTYFLKTKVISCRYWDTVENLWSSDGCYVDLGRTDFEKEIVCKCTRWFCKKFIISYFVIKIHLKNLFILRFTKVNNDDRFHTHIFDW